METGLIALQWCWKANSLELVAGSLVIWMNEVKWFSFSQLWCFYIEIFCYENVCTTLNCALWVIKAFMTSYTQFTVQVVTKVSLHHVFLKLLFTSRQWLVSEDFLWRQQGIWGSLGLNDVSNFCAACQQCVCFERTLPLACWSVERHCLNLAGQRNGIICISV